MGRRIKAKSHLVLNDPALAQQLHFQGAGNQIIVSRADWPDDTINIDIPALIHAWGERARLYPDIYHYYPNEPIPTNEAELKSLLKQLVNFMKQLRVNKIKAVVGNFAWAKVLHWEDVQTGIWDEFIIEASKWTHEGWGFVGGHDYTWGVVPFGAAGRNPLDMLTPALVQPERWPTKLEVHDKFQNNWLMLRWMMLAERAKFLSVPMFKMLITETAWDRMPNLEHDIQIAPGVFRKNIIKEFDERFGPTRGPISQRHLFKYWFPHWTIHEAAMEQLKWMEKVYPDYVVGFHLFAVNTDWPDFNFADWPELLDMLAVYEGEGDLSVDTSIQKLIRVRPSGNFSVNVRNAPQSGNNVVGAIHPNIWTDLVLYENNEPIGENLYRPIKWNEGVAYVAFSVIQWEAVSTSPEKPISEENISALSEAYTNIDSEWSKLGGAISAIVEDFYE